MNVQPTIPSYDLYGESGDMPDILHCEPISSRAPLHDWHIKPHRHQRLHQFFVLSRGGGEVRIDGRRKRLEPPLLINMPPHAVHGFSFEAGTEGWVVTVPSEVFEADGNNPFAGLLSIAGTVSTDDRLMDLFNRTAEEYGRTDFGRAHALRSWAGLLATHVARLIAADNPEGGSGRSEWMRRFEALIETRFREHWTVERYADELAISPTHLSRIARAETGLPASRLIEARLIREARRSLAYTPMSISQIAYDLGFDDPAYFTRVFARATGHSPSQYRSDLDRAVVRSPQRKN